MTVANSDGDRRRRKRSQRRSEKHGDNDADANNRCQCSMSATFAAGADREDSPDAYYLPMVDAALDSHELGLGAEGPLLQSCEAVTTVAHASLLHTQLSVKHKSVTVFISTCNTHLLW